MKSLFLLSPSSHPEIHKDLYINGVILSIPWRGHQEYELVWDTSVLPIMLEKSAICHAIVKMDQLLVNLLKMARFLFDKVYPDGTKGVVDVVSMHRVRECGAFAILSHVLTIPVISTFTVFKFTTVIIFFRCHSLKV